MRIYKDLLGVQRQTTNAGVFLELGEIPLTIYAKRNCINNYFRIKVKHRVNPLTALVLMSSEFQDHGWVATNEDLLRGIGISTRENEKLCQESFVRLKDIFHQETFASINNDSSKLRTYSQLKINIGIENYLLSNLAIAERTSITKLRLSNHVLMI